MNIVHIFLELSKTQNVTYHIRDVVDIWDQWLSSFAWAKMSTFFFIDILESPQMRHCHLLIHWALRVCFFFFNIYDCLHWCWGTMKPLGLFCYLCLLIVTFLFYVSFSMYWSFAQTSNNYGIELEILHISSLNNLCPMTRFFIFFFPRNSYWSFCCRYSNLGMSKTYQGVGPKFWILVFFNPVPNSDILK